MPETERTVDIDAPPDLVMATITDFSSYPDFVPKTRDVEVLQHGGDSWEVRFRIKVIRDLSYVLKLVKTDELHLEWSLVEGVFKSNDGGWSLEPLDDGRRTRATYRLDVQVGIYVPGNIVKSLQERSLPETLNAFKQEAERRASAGS